MFTRGEGPMVSLQDASRRLQVPVDTLWKWITDGRLTAEVKPGRGPGLEYYLGSDEMKKARELRGDLESPEEAADEADTAPSPPNNVISVDFPELGSPAPSNQAPPLESGMRDALVSLANFRSDALAAIERQAGRDSAITELAAAVENLMNTTLEAMDRAQDQNEGRLVAELESLRVRLARQIQDREREDLRLRDELVATRDQLAEAVRAISPRLTLHPARASEATFARMDGTQPKGDASSGG